MPSDSRRTLRLQYEPLSGSLATRRPSLNSTFVRCETITTPKLAPRSRGPLLAAKTRTLIYLLISRYTLLMSCRILPSIDPPLGCVAKDGLPPRILRWGHSSYRFIQQHEIVLSPAFVERESPGRRASRYIHSGFSTVTRPKL